MQYRNLGKTGKQGSIIGLGCEHLDGKPYAVVKETIDAALDNGINILDVFMPGREVRENIAKALGARRKDVIIQGHVGSTDLKQQYDISRDLPTAQKYFEDMLRIFGGHVDMGMLFFIDSEEDYKAMFESDITDYIQKLKQNGDISHIGFSSHNPLIARRAIETGLPELMLFSINMAFDLCPVEQNALDRLGEGFDTEAFRGIDPDRAALYTLCEQKGVGITVMKTFGAGKLLSAEHTPFAQPMTSAQCIHYALSKPGVTSVMIGAQSAAQVADAVSYLDKTDEERDYSAILGTMRNDFRGSCVYCNHCLPCPSEINIASVNKYLDVARLDKASVPPSIRSHYGALAHHGSECISCGSCEERCPFGVSVIENMQEAAEVFGE